MLLQSHNEKIVFFPVLPKAWKSGTVTGLNARVGITADMTWSGGKGEVTLKSAKSQRIFIEGIGDTILSVGENKFDMLL